MEEKTKDLAPAKDYIEEDLEQEEAKPNESEEKKTQSREENSKFADIRRTKKENENLKKENSELKEALRNLKNNSIDRETLEDLGIENVDNEEDYKKASKYQKYKKEGEINPKEKTFEELYKELLADKKKQDEALAEKVKNKELIEEDTKNFKKTFNKNIKEVFEDKDFMDAYGSLLKYGNLTELYSSYQALKTTLEKNARDSKKAKGTLPQADKLNSGEKPYTKMSWEEKVKYLDSKYKN